MQVITRARYGASDVLEHRAMAAAAPGPGQVRVRVEAASINPYDWHAMVGVPYFARGQFGWRRPRMDGLGADFAGVIDAVGGCTFPLDQAREAMEHLASRRARGKIVITMEAQTWDA